MNRPPQPDAIATVPLRHDFTKPELAAMSAKQNVHLGNIGRIEAELRSLTAKCRASAQAEMDMVQALRKRMEKGHEERPREVRVIFNPTSGVKTYRTLDGVEYLGEAKMLPEDYELGFQFGEKP